MRSHPARVFRASRTDPARFVAKLRKEPGKGICVMDGGELAAALFDAGLIDEVVLNTHPVLLGAGIPLFPGLEKQIDLKLLEARTLSNGCVVLFYGVLSGPADGFSTKGTKGTKSTKKKP